MRLKRELRLLTLVAMMLVICIVVGDAASSRYHVEPVQSRRDGPGGCVDCLSTVGASTLRSTTDDRNSDEVRPYDYEAIQLGRSVHRAHAEKLSNDGPPTESEDRGRRRRSLRPTKTVELAETSRDQLFTLGTDYSERFAFEDPSPRQLDISAVMGNVQLRDGHRLDYETEPEIEFVVIVTRVDDVACEYRFIFVLLSAQRGAIVIILSVRLSVRTSDTLLTRCPD